MDCLRLVTTRSERTSPDFQKVEVVAFSSYEEKEEQFKEQVKQSSKRSLEAFETISSESQGHNYDKEAPQEEAYMAYWNLWNNFKIVRMCPMVLLEFNKYAIEVDVDFVGKVVRAIGCYAINYESITATLCESLDTLGAPEVKNLHADELLESFLEGFPEEPAQVRLQLLTATVKLFLKKPTEAPQQMIQVVLDNATVETGNPDLRDHAYIYWHLLSTDSDVFIFSLPRNIVLSAAIMAIALVNGGVLRGAKWTEEDAEILIPGSIVSIKLGDIIPADACLLDLLKIDQSALASESLPMTKAPGDGIYSGNSQCWPTDLSVSMAIGSHRLSQQVAITKRMTTIKEMAGMDVLCGDKTGTMTLNRLTVGKSLTESILSGKPRCNRHLLLSGWLIQESVRVTISCSTIPGEQLAIAKETGWRLGMGTNMYPSSVLLGQHKDESIVALPVDELIEKGDGFAGVFHDHKYEIVKHLQARKHICRMTGNVVNDAPALKKADIGKAVADATDAAHDATDAAHSAFDIVLTETGLSFIISAILTSRDIF
ncbi:H[+]-ATPase 11 [Actinidia rufa]|uniref:H[+]-ATPase 11 n=1 Tax=Actinidia rufa TaxID=165716 RepID=A0A7J0GMD1_9ERIC|nr:H[+]-ATPase 11 [Actinidia rufa]